ncbi:hypothetical protein STCU_00089 [Strigomonas culicis]|uniref:tRNA/rRNA methyltransferase SpoU type domain-containing protein n=1 Tax=Strigomonas culicis TaxID=28005 RepID=S9TS02_9TRYP|nr:hypothetical protein STCU_08680 [Strigomonas culicis]EPY37208.1 hypothetical protein STCU_00089 [Strigomonas culicis]|eukprot:EPY21137.1 hypothetical protein STCU_08680 [Strigomonas culicis]
MMPGNNNIHSRFVSSPSCSRFLLTQSSWMKRSICAKVKKDFDAWAYNIFWPREGCNPKVQLTVEDIKFAYNAWSLLRLAMFYNTPYPKVLSSLTNTTPSMDIVYGGNRLFHMYSATDARLSAQHKKIALTPQHEKAVSLQDFFRNCGSRHSEEKYELVLGMENGLSSSVAAACDIQCYIPQYGSIGSLSMLSALAIATHIAASSPLKYSCPGKGHMPRSNHSHHVTDNGAKNMPHETDLLHLSNQDIKELLKTRRDTYSLQLAVMMYNDFGDRNISAVMRNANVYNCEKMIVVNRRKFNRRGAVGTQKVLDVVYTPTVDECTPFLDGYAVWLLYPYYPFLHVYGKDFTRADQEDGTFLRPHDPRLLEWLSTGHVLSPRHPLCQRHPQLCDKEVFLDDEQSLLEAVGAVKSSGYRGIMLVVPEEGASTHLNVEEIAHKVLFITHPHRLQSKVQRGLNPALSTAIAFERIRTIIDSV